MNEVDEISQKILLEFLQDNLPIKKLKDGRRFKRGIIINGNVFNGYDRKTFLKPQNELHATFALLYTILEDVFAFSNLEITMALYKFLGII